MLFLELWSETNEKARAPFVTAMEKSKAKYEKEMEVYRQTTEYAEFQRAKKLHNLIAKYVARIPDAKTRTVYKCFPTDPNKPRQPMASYFLFANDNRDAMRKNTPMQPWLKLGKMLGEAWKNVSGTVRSKYEKQQAVLKEKYEIAVEKYQSTKKCKEYLAIREEYDSERKEMNKPAKK
eukprot:UN22362